MTDQNAPTENSGNLSTRGPWLFRSAADEKRSIAGTASDFEPTVRMDAVVNTPQARPAAPKSPGAGPLLGPPVVDNAFPPAYSAVGGRPSPPSAVPTGSSLNGAVARVISSSSNTGGPIGSLDQVSPSDSMARADTVTSARPNGIVQFLGAAAVVVVLAGLFTFVGTRVFGGDSDNSSETTAGPIINPTVQQMAQATVHIIGLGAEAPCSGSGTFVSADGLILTNAHVVTRDAVCDFTSIGVGVTSDPSQPPQLLYEAELLVVDPEVDLAVIRVSTSIDGEPIPSSFPWLAPGDSNKLSIGDNIRILGYPKIGGETITFTRGSVSGFTAQAGIGDRAMIKTDGTIAGGNSGGAAVDADGRLIGIPTKARASESGPAVDCRPIADTNGDSFVDENDNCVPIGGFLNGIRPINLARTLIDEATRAEPLPIQDAPNVQINLDDVVIDNPRFSLGETSNSPTNEVVTAVAGTKELCLFVNWSGIPDGAEWDGLWYYEKTAVQAYSLVKQSWEYGHDGENFWMCAIDEQNGLPPGLYELGFFLNEKLAFAEGIVLTEAPVDVIDTTWENTTDTEVCGLAINPEGSGPVGLNELPPGTTIPPGGSIVIQLPVGPVTAKAFDCSGEPLADSKYTNVAPPGEYAIGPP